MSINKSRNMNNQKESLFKKTKHKNTTQKAAMTFGKVLSTLVLIIIISGCMVAGAFTLYVMSYADSRLEFPLDNFKLDYTSIIYATDPNTGETVELERLYLRQNRIWVDLKEIPQNMQDAFIAVEDQRFESHNGVDWKRTSASFINLIVPIMKGTPGGSTITQQLIKNLTGNDEVRIDRKLREIMCALNLEKDYSKDEIMQAYLNTIFLGRNCNGVQVAAQTYFDKNVTDLTLAECASIAAITQNPSRYEPLSNPNNNRERQLYVLSKMLEIGKITKEEYDDAVNEKMNFATEKQSAESSSKQSYFVDQVIEDVIADLMEEKGYERIYAENQLLVGGYRIYATVDLNVQKIMDEAYMSQSTFPLFTGRLEQPQSSMIIMDHNGKILGLVGGRGEKTGDRVLNRATQSRRQPGSSIKPLSVYAPAIENNIVNWSTIMNDSPLPKTATNSWSPRNYSGKYLGNMTIEKALELSINTIPAKIVVNDLTPRTSFDYLTNRFGITTLVSNQIINGKNYTDIGPAAMSIGAVTRGLNLKELTGAYQAFANGGKYTKPYTYTKVEDSDGKTILENKPRTKQILGEDTSFIMNKLLQRVVEGPSGTCRAMKISGMTVCAKSGTTENNRDRLAIGFTPYYVAGVWVGYDIERDLKIGNNTSPANTAWQIVMSKLHQGKQDQPFTAPDSVEQASYCPASGGLATSNCPSRLKGWYKKGQLPAMCTYHVRSSSHTSDTPSSSSDPAVSVPDDPAVSSEPPVTSEPVTSTPSSEPPPPDTSSIPSTSQVTS